MKIAEWCKEGWKGWSKRLRAAVIAIGIAVALAAITAPINWEVERSLVSWTRGLFQSRPEPTEAEAVTRQLYRDAEQMTFWVGKPDLLPQSRRYLLAHFRANDPRKIHWRIPRFPLIPPAELAAEVPVFAGGRVDLVGRVHAINVAGKSPGGTWMKVHGDRKLFPNLTYLAQLGGGRRDDVVPLVYCLYTQTFGHKLVPGMWAVAIGTPIAFGNARLNGGGSTIAVMFAASSIEPIKSPHGLAEAIKNFGSRSHDSPNKA
jgi:hypothetical protein